MTVRELIRELKKHDADRIVIMAGDGEGNCFSPLCDIAECAYQKLTDWHGLVGPQRLTPELREQGYTGDDVIRGKPALCLWPEN